MKMEKSNITFSQSKCILLKLWQDWRNIFWHFSQVLAIKNGIAEVAKKKQLSWVMFSHICAKHLLSKDFIVQIYPNGKMLKYAPTRSLGALRAPTPGWRPLVLLPSFFLRSSTLALWVVTHADESSWTQPSSGLTCTRESQRPLIS